MERDFMGLNSKESVVVKEEFVEGGYEDSGIAKSLSVPWPLSNKMSALPQFMSLKYEQDEKPSMKSDLLASHGYMVKPGSDVSEAMHKIQSGNIQLSVQQNGNSAHQIHDFKMHPSLMTSPYLKSRFMGACQNFGGATVKQQFLGGNPPTSPHSIIPSAVSVPRTTEQWINSKASAIPPQLTIFYGGTVNVFDDISPEKAQAIMFLAGNGFISSNMAQSKQHMQAPGLPSPMSVSSHPIDQSCVPAANHDDVKVSMTVGMSTTLANKVELPRVISSIGSVAASAMISSAVPQARKASLARFLEKRKERAMSAAPYSLSKKAADCATPESNGFGFSATSGISSSKEISGDN